MVFLARVHCQESGEESSETESIYSLKCHISQEVNHLHEGLRHVSVISLQSPMPYIYIFVIIFYCCTLNDSYVWCLSQAYVCAFL